MKTAADKKAEEECQKAVTRAMLHYKNGETLVNAGIHIEEACIVSRVLSKVNLKVVKDEWQDISTAPKDGTKILLYDKGNIFTGEWSEREKRWEVICQSFSHATKWQPLPTPPKEDE